MKTAIITGITGQDGAYLAKLLLDKGYKVVGVIRTEQTKPAIGLQFLNIFDKIEFKQVNLLEKFMVEELIKAYQPNEFYNLAAQSSVGYSFKEPVNTFEFNNGKEQTGIALSFFPNTKQKESETIWQKGYKQSEKLYFLNCLSSLLLVFRYFGHRQILDKECCTRNRHSQYIWMYSLFLIYEREISYCLHYFHVKDLLLLTNPSHCISR